MSTLYFSNRCGYCKELFAEVARHGKKPEAMFRLVCIDAVRPPPDVACVPTLRTDAGLLTDEALFEHLATLLRPPPEPFALSTEFNEGYAFLDAKVPEFDTQRFEYVERAHAPPQALPAAAVETKKASAAGGRSYEQLMQDRDRDLESMRGAVRKT